MDPEWRRGSSSNPSWDISCGTARARNWTLAPGECPQFNLPLTVWRILHVHFAPTTPGRYRAEHFPIGLWEDETGIYSAFPELTGQGVKFGRHNAGEVCTPETVRRTAEPAELEELGMKLEQHWPAASGPMPWYLTCLYTRTPDHHFPIDRTQNGHKWCSAAPDRGTVSSSLR